MGPHTRNVIRKQAKNRITVSLSEKTARDLSELEKLTDAVAVSEVVRNSLRLHHKLLKYQQQGKSVYIVIGEEKFLLPVDMMAPSGAD